MNEQRFALSEYSTVYRYSVIDNIQKGTLKANEIIILLNRMSYEIDGQQAIIEAKDKEIAELKSEKTCTDKKNDDIHKWSNGRYTLMFDEHTFFVWDNENEKQMTALQVTKKLNEQQCIIQKEKGEKINAEEKLAYMVWKYNKLKQKNFDLLSEQKELQKKG